MSKKSTDIIVLGGLFIICLATVVSMVFNRKMSRQTDTDISLIARTYVSSLSQETLKRFYTVSGIYFSQNARIEKKLIENGTRVSGETLRKVVEDAVLLQDPSLIALLDETGRIISLVGDGLVSIDDLSDSMEHIARGSRSILSGHSRNQQYVLWINPVSFILETGEHVVAILRGVGAGSFEENMGLMNRTDLCRFSFIRTDGSYLFRNSSSGSHKFVSEVLLYGTPDNGSGQDAALYLLDRMKNGEDFVLTLHYDYDGPGTPVHENRGIYGTPIEGCNWYLLSTLPYGVLDEMIRNMTESRYAGMWKALGVLAVGILIVFFYYVRMTQRQMQKLTLTEEAAVAAKNEAEAAREAMQFASQAKSEFLSNMSHDMRTPMNAIIGMATIAQQNLHDQRRVEVCISKITLAGKHLLGLINDVLDMAKIETGRMILTPEPVSLRQAMKTVCDITRPQIEANRQHFDIYTQNITVEDIYCDGTRLHQILLNLINNAMKFTPREGSISVEFSEEPSEKGDGYVRLLFSVRDTGIGISPEFQEKLFTAFEREDRLRVKKAQGTGLGLAITKHIVDAMGGTITVESTVGQGSTFRVTIDVERVNTLEQMYLPHWKILVVDDNSDVCASTMEALHELGAEPSGADSVEQAVECVRKALEEKEPFFAAFIDNKLGKESGLELSQRLTEMTDHSLIIFLVSAYSYVDSDRDLKDYGISGFLTKPLFKTSLYYELNRYRDRYTTGEEAVAPQEAPEQGREFSLEGLHFLLAEDIAINAEVAIAILEAFGATVEHAEDGSLAVELFEKSAPQHFDVILMDLRMPNMNGFEATQSIRNLNRTDAKRIPIIALTADAFVEDAQKCIASGMDAHLSKPLDIDRLKQTLSDILAARDS